MNWDILLLINFAGSSDQKTLSSGEFSTKTKLNRNFNYSNLFSLDFYSLSLEKLKTIDYFYIKLDYKVTVF